MSAPDITARLAEALEGLLDGSYHPIEGHCAAMAALAAYRANPSGWIPVGERLPEEGERVSICTIYKVNQVVSAQIERDGFGAIQWATDPGGYLDIHEAPLWQPLPFPPQQEGQTAAHTQEDDDWKRAGLSVAAALCPHTQCDGIADAARDVADKLAAARSRIAELEDQAAQTQRKLDLQWDAAKAVEAERDSYEDDPHTEAALRGDLELLNRTVAELLGTAFEELGILYPDGNKSFGNSEEYTRQKCDNYQRQGLGCKLIERVATHEEYTTSLDACRTFSAQLTHGNAYRFNCILELISLEKRKWQYQLEAPDYCIAFAKLRGVCE